MNYYNIQYSPKINKNEKQRNIYNKKKTIHGSRIIKNINLNDKSNKNVKVII